MLALWGGKKKEKNPIRNRKWRRGGGFGLGGGELKLIGDRMGTNIKKKQKKGRTKNEKKKDTIEINVVKLRLMGKRGPRREPKKILRAISVLRLGGMSNSSN